MPVPQQKFREVVFQLLYSLDMGATNDKNMIELLSKELAVTKKIVHQAQERVHDIHLHLEKIDSMIAKTSHSYAFERIQSVERNLLRLGIFELFFDHNIPPKVAIAEAIRLARKFATRESAVFVNAILDTLYKSSLGENIDKKILIDSAEKLSESEKIANEASQKTKENKNKID